jgi:hypothetical protein
MKARLPISSYGRTLSGWIKIARTLLLLRLGMPLRQQGMTCDVRRLHERHAGDHALRYKLWKIPRHNISLSQDTDVDRRVALLYLVCLDVVC